MHPFNGNEIGDGRGVSGNRLALAPRSGWAVFTVERSLLAVNIHSLESRTLIADVGHASIFGAPSISADETKVVVALSSAHPQILAGDRVDKDYLSYPDHHMKLVVVPLTGGPPRVIYERQPCQCSHSSYNPVVNDLVYFDVNVPPLYWCGNDGGVTPRLWLMSDQGGNARPLRCSYPGVFTVHAAWTWDGAAIAYHGFLTAAGYASGIFIGLATSEGPDPKRPALILDGDLLQGCLAWLYHDRELPRLEVICRHDTEWESMPGQYSHPHPQSDPTGRWISYNAAKGGRSDVFVVDTAEGVPSNGR
jgi:Tol biopolymer transport system component